MALKFYLDKETLTYKPFDNGFKSHIKRSFKYVAISCLTAFTYWILSYFGMMPSLMDKTLSIANSNLVKQVNSLNSTFDSISNQLTEIQFRDDYCYRVITQKQPLPSTVRQAGFGGVNKYENLMGSEFSELLIETNLKSDVLLNQMKLQSQSYDTIYISMKNLEDSIFAVPAIQPVSPYDYNRISSLFGYRMHPISGVYTMHDGIDFAGEIGKPVHATGSGIVISVGNSVQGYGNRIVIDHGFGYKTLYAHLSKMYVQEGQTVNRGTEIGAIGNTGSSTGPHLHYEVIYNDKKHNPINYYLDDLSDKEYKAMIKGFALNKVQ